MEMNSELVRCLRTWALQYHTGDFIGSDPVQFPHRYTTPADIEISGLLTAVLSFGNRKQILRKADELDDIMQHCPLRYVLSEQWKDDFPAGDGRSFYRMMSYDALRGYFEKLYAAYTVSASLEEVLLQFEGIPMERLCEFLNVSASSPQKKLNMYLRWMIRRNSAVDFGLWKHLNPSELLIPLDTHVCRVAHRLGLIDKPVFSLATARKITECMAQVFPGDPCLGDFALFGYGVTHP